MSVAWADSAMSSSHGTVADCRNEELKTKGWQIAKSGPTTWTTQHEQREVDPPCVIKQKAHTLKVRGPRARCGECGHCGVVRENTDTKESHESK